MRLLISVGILLFIVVGIFLCWRYRKVKLSGDTPSSSAVLVAILFTSGLDSGFILMPLVEFPSYQSDPSYGFVNPLAIELGFWGLTAWFLYFVSTLYFLTLEPKLQLFKRPAIRLVNSLVVLMTCAFTLSLFLQLIPQYTDYFLTKISELVLFALLFFMIIFALLVSTKVRFMTRLSQVSVLLFCALILVIGITNDFSSQDLVTSLAATRGYLANFHQFILPFNDYHEFYLAWWLTWTILLGQFVAKFVNQMSPFKLLLTMVLIPLIPTAIWFSVLYHHFIIQAVMSPVIAITMVLLALLFVVNSLDFMVAHYSQSLSIDRKRLGMKKFVLFNSILLLMLTAMFKEQWLFIQWTALLVILIALLGLLEFLTTTRLKQLHLHINNFVKVGVDKR